MMVRLALSPLLLMAFVSTPGIAVQANPTEKVLLNFKSVYTGQTPNSGVVFGPDGALYGTTMLGGNPNFEGGNTGVIFKLMPPAPGHTAWAEIVLHRFKDQPTDGRNPYGALVFNSSGAMFGTTNEGGANGYGTVFKLTPVSSDTTGTRWRYSVIHSFSNSDSNPQSTLVVDKAGALYGTTGGAVFKLTPPTSGGTTWKESVIHTFTGAAGDGYMPNSVLTLDTSGAILGTTQRGGGSIPNSTESGSVFKLTPPAPGHTAWKQTILFSFINGDTSNTPKSGVAMGPDGALYGTTYFGADGYGAVYKLTPPATSGGKWTEALIHRFEDADDGRLPIGGVVIDKAGNLYGTTSAGGNGIQGSQGGGVVFEMSPPPAGQTDWAFRVLYSFVSGNPQSSMILDASGAVYGTTPLGGSGGKGTVFKIVP